MNFYLWIFTSCQSKFFHGWNFLLKLFYTIVQLSFKGVQKLFGGGDVRLVSVTAITNYKLTSTTSLNYIYKFMQYWDHEVYYSVRYFTSLYTEKRKFRPLNPVKIFFQEAYNTVASRTFFPRSLQYRSLVFQEAYSTVHKYDKYGTCTVSNIW